MLLAAILAWLLSEWVRRAELLGYSTQVSESVPPIAVVWVISVLLATRVWRDRRRMALLYVFLTVASAMASTGAIRMFFPFLTAAQYFSESHPSYAGFLGWLQYPFFPAGQETIRAFYEGAEREAVPWGAWALPLVLWLGFFGAFFWTTFSLLSPLWRRWHEKEKLSFPLAQFGLAITEGASFFRNPLVWAGFGAAALFTLTNILSAFNPSVPHLGRSWGFAFPERPWSGFSMGIVYHPTVFGLAWLAPLDVSFSVWASYLLARMESVGGCLLGSQNPGIPFEHYQAVGGYAGLFLVMAWTAHKAFREAAPRAIIGLAAMVIFGMLAGLEPLTAVALFGSVVAFALVCAKLRAEAGTPFLWTIPRYGHHDVLHAFLPSRLLKPQNLTLLTSFTFLTRGCLLALPAYQSDGMEMAESARIPQRQMRQTIIGATAIGLVLAFWIHLTSYYRYGCGTLDTADPTTGGDAMTIAQQEYDRLSATLASPDGERASALTWTGVGLMSVVAATVLRRRFFGFPLHPMGFVIAMTNGGIWSMFLFAWLAKATAMKLGGLRLQQALTPAMLGIVFGEFFAAGAWSLACVANPDWADKWVISFR